MMTRPLAIAVLAVVLALGGCVSLFPKGKPAQLYKLSGPEPAAEAPSTSGPAYTVLKAPTAFTRASANDRILTTTGQESAYIAQARWAAPVSVMFDEILSSAFSNAAPGIRLSTRGDVVPAEATLRVEVRTFEAQYRSGHSAAPTVVVEARATLSDLRNRRPVADRIFRVEEAASGNRVSAIVAAFDAATSSLTTDIARWTQASAAAAR